MFQVYCCFPKISPEPPIMPFLAQWLCLTDGVSLLTTAHAGTAEGWQSHLMETAVSLN